MSNYIAVLNEKWGGNGWIPLDVRATLNRPNSPARDTCKCLWKITVQALSHNLHLPSLWAPNGLMRAGLQSETGNLTLTATLTKKIWERMQKWTPADIELAQRLSNRVKSAEAKVGTAKPKVETTKPKVQSALVIPRPLTADNLFYTLTNEKTWLQSDEVHFLCSVVATKTPFTPIHLLEAQGLLDLAETKETTDKNARASLMRRELVGDTKLVFICPFSSHWTVSILSRQSSTNTYVVHNHDSLPSHNRKDRVRNAVMEYLKRIGWQEQVEFVDQKCPTQPDTDSCGVFAVECLYSTLQNEHGSWSESRVSPLALRHKYLRMLAELSSEESSKLPPSYQEVVCKIKEKRKFDMGRGATELWTETLFDGSKKAPVNDQDDFEISTREDAGQLRGAKQNNNTGVIPPPSPSLLKDTLDGFDDDTTVIIDTEDTFMPNGFLSASLEVEERSMGLERQELDAKLKRLKRKKAKIEEEIKATEKKRAKCV